MVRAAALTRARQVTADVVAAVQLTEAAESLTRVVVVMEPAAVVVEAPQALAAPARSARVVAMASGALGLMAGIYWDLGEKGTPGKSLP